MIPIGDEDNNFEIRKWGEPRIFNEFEPLAHEKLGWQEITERVAQVLGERDVIAVLWGSAALPLKPFFHEQSVITSVHPSPLSAYRGFFGSSPFSQVNAMLRSKGLQEIHW